MTKIFNSALEAIFDITDNMSIMSGGFGLCGNPENLILAIKQKGIKNIKLISNNCGTADYGLGILLKNKQIKKIYASYVGENNEFEHQFLTGHLEVELIPQGTLAEKIRAGGAGIPAFFTSTGVDTQVMNGGIPILFDKNGAIIKKSKKKEMRIIQNKKYILEESLIADIAIIKAHVADTFGNLIFHKTTNNFSAAMCAAAKLTIVETEKIVHKGELNPNHIHVPGIYVNRIILGKKYKKVIEKRTVINIL